MYCVVIAFFKSCSEILAVLLTDCDCSVIACNCEQYIFTVSFIP